MMPPIIAPMLAWIAASKGSAGFGAELQEGSKTARNTATDKMTGRFMNFSDEM
jgi:hypothetical protein